MGAIPVIDLAPFLSGRDPAGVAAEWDAAMRAYGFAQVANHAIPHACVNGVYDQAQLFFAQPLPEKMKVCFGDMKRGQGYGPMLNETVGKARDATARPDLCESLSFSATPGARPNLWPELPGLRRSLYRRSRPAVAGAAAPVRHRSRAAAGFLRAVAHKNEQRFALRALS